MNCRKCGAYFTTYYDDELCPECSEAQYEEQILSKEGKKKSKNKPPEEVHEKMNFSLAIKAFFKNCFDFNGRATKSEYWWAILFTYLFDLPFLAFSFYVISTEANNLELLESIISLVKSGILLIPRLSLSVRRLHDVGKKGTYLFVEFIPVAGIIMLLIQMLKDSVGANEYGLKKINYIEEDK